MHFNIKKVHRYVRKFMPILLDKDYNTQLSDLIPPINNEYILLAR